MSHGLSTEFPLTPAQLGMWYAQQLDPGVPLYEAQYIEMRGQLDVGALTRAARRAAREFGSGILRLAENDSGPYQVTDERLEPEVAYLDVGSAADPDAEALRWMRADVAAPIDLLADRLGRTAVIRVGPERALWYSRIHHIALDGFGSATMLYRVAELYNAELAGVDPKPAVAAGLYELYQDELRYRESSRFDADAAYWAERIDGMPPRCSLVEAAAPAHALGRQQRMMLPEQMSALIDAAADSFGVGAPALVMAALAVYYGRLTGLPEVVLSLPVSGRTTAISRRSGGMLANVVPLRVEVTERRTIAEVIDAIRLEVSGALRHQRFRHEEIRGTSDDDHLGGRGFLGPVVNIMLFPARVDFAGIETNLHVLTSGPIEDLFVNLYQHGAGSPIHVDFTANPDLYDAGSLARHHRRFLRTFEALLTAPADTPVGGLDCFLDDERHLLNGLHGAAAAPPQLLPDLLDAGMRAAGPDAVAVCGRHGQLTYRELDEAANRLARTLIDKGAGPESAVLVALPRSTESVIAFWAVARSGAAYVPLGTGNPPERVARIAVECGAHLGITKSSLRDALTDAVDWIVRDSLAETRTTLHVDANHEAANDVRGDCGQRPGSAGSRRSRVDCPAYIVFTSGSTGVPKGVVVPHTGLAGLVAAVRDTYRAQPGSRVLHCLNPAFDASLLELLVAFTAGATLVIGDGEVMAGAELATVIRESGITQLCSTPAVLATLPDDALIDVRAVSTGGEACPPEIVERFGTGRRLVNSYGPSEATVAATFTEPLAVEQDSGIGAPVPGAGLMVLDRRLRPVPIGTPGELYLSGSGLARGYTGRVGTTAARFVANPFGPPGTRMYRTGDLVQWRSVQDAARAGAHRSEPIAEARDPGTRDGVPPVVLDYLGRTDFQLKVRGMRVEPGEVDAVLDAHPEVEIAVTVPRSGGQGRAVLASYVVLAHRGRRAQVQVAALRKFCASRLPSHMVPATITLLDALPLTGNGKVNRAALPEPVLDSHESDSSTTESAHKLGELFAAVLEVPDVGPESSFFALGGDSILSIQLVARAREAGLVFSARDVFEHQTPAALAEIATESTGPQTLPERGDAAPMPQRGDVGSVPQLWWEPQGEALRGRLRERYPNIEEVWPLTPLQRGLLFHAQLNAGRADDYSVQAVFEFEGPVDIERLVAAATELTRRHQALRTAFVADADAPVQVVLADVELPWRTIDATRGDVADLAAEELARPFDPAHAPLIRFLCLRCAPQDVRLVVTNHHLVLDGWSMPLLFGEFLALYQTQGDSTGFATPVPLRGYLDWLSYKDDAAALANWRAALDGLPAPTVVTAAREQIPESSGPAKRELAISLPESTATALSHWTSTLGVTVNTVIQTAWALLLTELTGHTDLVFGTTVSGRPADLPGAEHMIGMLVNTIPVRITLAPEETVGALLSRVQREQAALIEQHTVGLSEIQAAAGLGPLFDTTLVVESYPLDLPALLNAADRVALRVKNFRSRNGTHYPLSLEAKVHDGLAMVLTCSARYFDATEASALAARLTRLLTRIAEDPAQRVVAVRGVDQATVLRTRTEPIRLLPDLLTGGVRHGATAIVATTDELVSVDRADSGSGIRRGGAASVGRTDELGYSDRGSGPELLTGGTDAGGAVAAGGTSGLDQADGGDGSDVPVGEIRHCGAATKRAAVAAAGDAGEVGYVELDERSNRLARLLIGAGAGPETAVLLALPRSCEWLVAAWAIAKSGAAFVPVDVDYPAARVAAIASDCVAHLGITGSRYRDHLPDKVSWLAIDDSDSAQVAGTPITDADRIRALRAGNPAYVVYTSGSTGAPKGVVITHAGLSGLVAGVSAKVRARPGDRVLLCMNPNFDAAIMVWLSSFAAGATVVVAPHEVNAGAELAALIAASGATHVFSTPAVLATLPAAALAGVRVLITGGEACPPELTARLGGGRVLLNSYGPAETTVAATFTGALTAGEPATLGSPMPGMGLAVLDSWLRPVPTGVPGELYLMGPGLSRGYIGRAVLTGERFVANPFGAPGDRMYRTGDLVRKLSHSRLEYLGRNDSQVKLHGIRVEPGEIDAVLRSCPRVALAVTVPRPGPSGDRVLDTYAVASDGAELTAAFLRDYLTHRLPRHLIPATLTVLDALPLTGNGKVDVRALPEPDPESADYVTPVGLERVVADVFGGVLERTDIGAADDFFLLGGDSLSATRAASRLGAALKIDVPVRVLFEAPTVHELAARAQALIGTGASTSAGPRSGSRPELVPLSPAQQRMWFVNQYDPESGGYNIPIVLRLNGILDLPSLRAAVGDVLERHESLRTVYPARDGVGYQVVVQVEDAWESGELTAQPISASQLPAAVSNCIGGGFDVTAAVPLRLRLFEVRSGEKKVGHINYLLVLVVHHISADGFSMGPLARDVMTAYAARRQAHAPDWSPLPAQYADYTLWQRDRLGTAEDPDSLLSRQLTYWTETLDGLPDQLALPTDHHRPATATLRAGTVFSRIDAALVTELDALARAHQSSQFMVLHCALAALFARLSGSTDIAIGTPIAGRGAAELDDVIGMFVNTVVLRTEVLAEQSFTDLLAQVRRTDLDAFAHSDIPFEHLVDVLEPVRSAARHPLIQVMLVFQNLAPVQFTLPELTVEPLASDQQSIRFDLSITVNEDEDGLSVRFGYATDLFEPATVARFADRWLRLLRAVATDPDVPVGDIDLLGPSELAEVLAPAAPLAAAPVVLPDLLAAAVTANPEGIAVIDGAAELTYRDLDARSNQLARNLLRAGAGPETMVAVALHRSSDAVLAVWSIAKTGAAFVPVDPAYPSERIQQILGDSGAVLGISAVATVVPRAEGTSWLVLDDPATVETLAATAADPIAASELNSPLRVENPAYLIFTSGSTGTPKGVVVTHAGLANIAALQRDRLGSGPGSRFLALAAPSFDASVLDLLLVIGAAGTCVVAGQTAFGGTELAETLVSRRIAHLSLTPSALASVDAELPAAGAALRTIITGGEPCPPELVARWAPNRLFFNDYGPSETTIWATGSAPLHPGAEVTIGRPIAGMRARVLDDRLHPVPAGVAGELYLGGPALARGYHGRTGQTSARFVADPYGPAGERMYRTGDLVRARGGDLEYLGRTDLQVKLRGLRIELGEIESALLAQPSVHQAAVGVHTDPSVGELLVGYVVPCQDADFRADTVRAALAQRLPSYMVPAAIITLNALPRTGTGKLDRRALPAPDIHSGRYRPPGTPAEHVIADTFGELLGVSRVGLDDNFFALGGNSLIATRIVARLGAVLNTRIPVRTVFDAPTVAELAQAVRDATAPPGPRPGPRKRPEHVPLSAAQRRMWFLNRYDPGSPAHNVPIVLELRGELDPAVLRSALMDVVARHETLRTVYPVDALGEPYQDVRPLAEAIVPVHVSDVDPADQQTVIARLTAPGFDLTTDLPMRVHLLRAGPRRAILVVVMHHISSDGWSLAPLSRDVMVAVGARRAGIAPQFTPLPLQYADYALWQDELLGAEADPASVAHRQLEFWRAALDGIPEVSALPSDHPRPAVRAQQAGLIEFGVGVATQLQIRRIARWYGVSPFMVVHAVLAVLLARLSGAPEVTIGSVIAGRGDGELDDLVGMFVNTLVLRSRVAPRSTFETLLAATKDADLDAFGNADLPFERLVEVLAPARSTAQHPLFQVVLVFQNFEWVRLDLPGFEVETVKTGAVGAKFDLEWMLAEETAADGAPAGITGSLTYARDLFEPATAETLTRRFVELLETLTANPSLVLDDLDVTAPPGTVVYPAPPATPRRTDLPYRPPVTDAERAVVAAFESVLGAERVGLDDNFFELGGTSMVATRLVTEIRARLDFSMPVQWMFGDPTPGALAQRLTSGLDGPDALATILPLRPHGTGPALFCVHPAIGLAWGYAGLLRFLDPGYPVYGVQSPGIRGPEPDEPLMRRVRRYADEIQRTQPSGPYRLLGYSAGGPLAHAVAVELQHRGASVPVLIILDARADAEPETAQQLPPPEALLVEFGGIDPAALDFDPDAAPGPDLPPADLGPLAARAADLLHETGGTFAGLTAENLRSLYTDYRNLIRQTATYRPEPFAGDLLFCSSTDVRPDVPPNPETWRPYCTGAVTNHDIPFEHNKLTTPGAFAVIGPIVSAYLCGGD
ncbi:amino acid adenylation domain-containing protein [Nocardia sp. NPDC051832]|uniref:amino acid adenylation domain-containing protein n=1 Tax=Nocardia sp. NPDC051832 TaxID=3155673 RepID=UPI00343B1F75